MSCLDFFGFLGAKLLCLDLILLEDDHGIGHGTLTFLMPLPSHSLYRKFVLSALTRPCRQTMR